MVDLPIVGIFGQRQLQALERGLILAFDEMNQADLVMAGRVVRLKRAAALKRRQGLVVAPKLDQDAAEVEVREEIVFEVGDNAEFLSGFGEQTMALIIEAKRVVRLA